MSPTSSTVWKTVGSMTKKPYLWTLKSGQKSAHFFRKNFPHFRSLLYTNQWLFKAKPSKNFLHEIVIALNTLGMNTKIMKILHRISKGNLVFQTLREQNPSEAVGGCRLYARNLSHPPGVGFPYWWTRFYWEIEPGFTPRFGLQPIEITPNLD